MTTRKRESGEPSPEKTREAMTGHAPTHDAVLCCIDGRSALIFGWLYEKEKLTGDRVRSDTFDQLVAIDAQAAVALDDLAFVVATKGVNRRAG